MENKTIRRAKILRYIEKYTAENCCPPTVREIQKAFRIKSTSTVYTDLLALCDDGSLKKIGKSKLGGKFAPIYTESFKTELLKYI